MILIIYAHPYPHHSHANKRMLEQAGTLENVEIRSLYHLYPDFNIDVAAEIAPPLRIGNLHLSVKLTVVGQAD